LCDGYPDAPQQFFNDGEENRHVLLRTMTGKI
jgi:hypothetical protein